MLRHGLHSTPLVSPSNSSVVAGPGGRQPHDRGLRFAHHHRLLDIPTCPENKGSRLSAQQTSDTLLEVTVCFWRNNKIFGQKSISLLPPDVASSSSEQI